MELPSRFFEPYRPGRPGHSLPGLSVRPARPGDVPALADLTVRRGGGDPFRIKGSLEAELERTRDGAPGEYLCVAVAEDRVIGFGRCRLFGPDRLKGSRGLQEGWYLMGAIVAERFRRRGIGRALLLHRLEWLGGRTDRVFTFVNAGNLVSIELLRDAGFQERTRDLVVPGVSFTGGVGILFERELEKIR